MTTDTIRITTVVRADPDSIYRAWLDAAQHSAFTGGKATIEPWIGGRHSAWDGYIEGTTLELDPSRRIVQSWRSSDFPDDSPDSRLEVVLEPNEEGTRILLIHSEIPEGQGEKYRRGWQDSYFEPLARYFEGDEGDEGDDPFLGGEMEPEPEPEMTPPPPPARKPARPKPAARKPARKKPTGKKPARKKPASKKPARKKPARKQPARKKPARKRAAKRAVGRKAAGKAGRKGARKSAGRKPKVARRKSAGARRKASRARRPAKRR